MIYPWEQFFRDKMTKIFTEKQEIIDIGGGLRVLKNRGNRYDSNRSWLESYLHKVQYKILDPVPDYQPDIIGDIHALPFVDNSIDAILCLAVLEHVEDPFLAMREMHRALKPGGQLFLYVPFLFYYHAEVGYYKDFWRFTEDGVRQLGKNFSTMELAPVRGAMQTWLHLSPLGRFGFIRKTAFWFDRLSGKLNSRQVSGFNVFLVK